MTTIERNSWSRVVNRFTRAVLPSTAWTAVFHPCDQVFDKRQNVRDEQFILAHDLRDGVRYGRQSMAADSSLAVGFCGLDLVEQSEEMEQEAVCYKPQILAPRNPFP